MAMCVCLKKSDVCVYIPHGVRHQLQLLQQQLHPTRRPLSSPTAAVPTAQPGCQAPHPTPSPHRAGLPLLASRPRAFLPPSRSPSSRRQRPPFLPTPCNLSHGLPAPPALPALPALPASPLRPPAPCIPCNPSPCPHLRIPYAHIPERQPRHHRHTTPLQSQVLERLQPGGSQPGGGC